MRRNSSLSPDRIAAENRVAKAYLNAQGFGAGFVDAIHDADEMYTVLRHDPNLNPQSLRLLYFKSGYDALLSIQNMLRSAGRSLADLDVLEFACGYGRLTRFLVRETEPRRIWASDILRPAVDHVARTFGVNGFYSVTDPATLRIHRTFDLIFVGSLFSHLPRPRFAAWLKRLFDLLSDDGILLFSTHGYGVVPKEPKHASGFTFTPHSESQVLDGAEYGSTFVTEPVVREIARDAGIAAVHATERDLWGVQDLYAACRKPVPRLATWHRAQNVYGRIDSLHVVRDGTFLIEGWAAQVDGRTPIDDVRLLLNGVDAGGAHLDQARPDVAATNRQPQWERAGWRLDGRVADLPRDVHDVAAVGRAKGGAPICFDVMLLEYGSGEFHCPPK